MMPRIEAQQMLDAIRADQLAQPVSGASEYELQHRLDERQAELDRIRDIARGNDPASIRAGRATDDELAAMGLAVETADGPGAEIADLAAWLDQKDDAPPSDSSAEEDRADG